MKRSGWSAVLALAFACLCGSPPSAWGQATQTFLPYGSFGWRLQQYSGGLSTVPAEVFGTSYNDSAWVSTATPVGYVALGCTYTVYTFWNPAARTAVLRRSLVLPAGLGSLTIAWHAGAGPFRIYLNDRLLVSETESFSCMSSRALQMSHVPINDAWHGGANTLVVASEGASTARYVDVTVSGAIDPVPARGTSWGLIKALYRRGPHERTR